MFQETLKNNEQSFNASQMVNFSKNSYMHKTTNQNTKKIKLATLFSGIGAIEQTFIRLKIPHEIVFAGDIDKFVKLSYFANYDIDDSRWHTDVTCFNAEKYRKQVDILVGGSPLAKLFLW